MGEAVMTHSKAVFVDGPSAHKMKGPLGINLIDYRGLFDVLCNRVGSCRRLACTPLVTIYPDRFTSGDRLAKDLAGAGFDVLPAESRGGEDDKAIKRRINDIDSNRVKELVIVTSDKDFIPVLRQKSTEGVQVFWVATRSPSTSEGCRSLSREVLDLCTTGVFRFVELSRFSREITLKRQSAMDMNVGGAPGDNTVTVISLRFKSRSPAEHLRFASEVASLKLRFPGLTFKVEE